MAKSGKPGRPTVFSGIKPSGDLAIGNYFGALRRWVTEQDAKENYFCVVDMHTITVPQDQERLRRLTRETVALYIASGLDPEKSTIFIQSHVAAHAELCWILNCVTPMGWLGRMTQFKVKSESQDSVSTGLFDYPVLQAADIIIYDSNIVPVGADQKQHIEMTRDLAIKFNLAFGETLVVPEAYIVKDVAVVPGIDGQKMSKSYGNVIELFDTPKATAKRCAKIVTDPTPLEDAKDPDSCTVFALLKLLAGPEEIAKLEGKYRAGGYGYGEAKGRLTELINEQFAAARDRYAELAKSPDTVRDILREGGRKARDVAEATLQRVRAACGIVTNR